MECTGAQSEQITHKEYPQLFYQNYVKNKTKKKGI